MKTRTILPERVLEVATEIHLSLVESNFYAEECQVEVNELDCIEFIGERLLPKFFSGSDLGFPGDEFKTFLQELILFTVVESLFRKGLLDSIEDENDEEHLFIPTDVKKVLVENLKP